MDAAAALAPPHAFPIFTPAPQWGGGCDVFGTRPVGAAATARTRGAAAAYVAGGGAPRLSAPRYVKRPGGWAAGGDRLGGQGEPPTTTASWWVWR